MELCGVVGGAKVVGSGLGLEVELVLVVLVVVVPLVVVVVVVEVVGGGWVLGTGVALGEVLGTGVGEVVLCLLGVILGEVVCGTG